MAAITISRQWGSLGMEVAQEVAHRLAYQLVWQDLINQAARRAGMPETALAAIDELGLLGMHLSRKALQGYLRTAQQVIQEVADAGSVVIVGRAGQVILRDHPAVLHVRITAPISLRAERISRARNVSLDAAYAQLEASDQARHDYLRRHYHVSWDDLELYDLVVNTARLSQGSATDLVCQAFDQFRQNCSPLINCADAIGGTSE